MATNRYPNSSKETIPTMMFSIETSSQPFAQADINRAHREEQCDHSDVIQIGHKCFSFQFDNGGNLALPSFER